MPEHDSQTVEGQLFEAAKNGDAVTVAALLDHHPEKLQARLEPLQPTPDEGRST